MIKNIIILLLLSLGILALVLYYKQSSFNLSADSLAISSKQKSVTLPYKEIKKSTKNFSNVNVTQRTLISENNKLIYEVATINGLYEFSGSPSDIISKLFSAKDIKKVWSYRGLEALQLTLADNQKINLLYLQTDSKKIELLYGLSNELFLKTLKELSEESIKLEETTTPTEPLTKWSVEVNDVDGIISSIDH